MRFSSAHFYSPDRATRRKSTGAHPVHRPKWWNSKWNTSKMDPENRIYPLNRLLDNKSNFVWNKRWNFSQKKWKNRNQMSFNQPINQPTEESTNQPINQSINDSTNQSINQWIDQSTDQSINQLTQSINQLTRWDHRFDHQHFFSENKNPHQRPFLSNAHASLNTPTVLKHSGHVRWPLANRECPNGWKCSWRRWHPSCTRKRKKPASYIPVNGFDMKYSNEMEKVRFTSVPGSWWWELGVQECHFRCTQRLPPWMLFVLNCHLVWPAWQSPMNVIAEWFE